MLSLLSMNTAARPNAYPKAPPTINWMANDKAMSPLLTPDACTNWMSTMVSIYAIGSLLPLSNSSMGRRLCFRLMFCERSIANTEAESVDDMVEANSREVVIGKAMLDQLMPDIHHINMPVKKAVSNTPMVDSIIP